MPKSLVRVFFAIDLPAEHKQLLAKRMQALKSYLNPLLQPYSFASWVKPDSLHLTLQFLGEIPEDEIPGLLEREQQALEGISPFQLNLGALQWFPNSHRPSVLSIEAGPQETLAQLSHVLGVGALDRGYILEDRPFRPHITLARLENLREPAVDILTSFVWEKLPPVLVKEVVLFRSDSGVYGLLGNLRL